MDIMSENIIWMQSMIHPHRERSISLNEPGGMLYQTQLVFMHKHVDSSVARLRKHQGDCSRSFFLVPNFNPPCHTPDLVANWRGTPGYSPCGAGLNGIRKKSEHRLKHTAAWICPKGCYEVHTRIWVCVRRTGRFSLRFSYDLTIEQARSTSPAGGEPRRY